MRCRAATPPGAGRTLAPMTDALPPAPPATIQLLRAGRHIASDGRGRDYPAAELADMCAVYDPALYQAPIVVGHPTDDAPAYGWLAALRYDPVAQAVEGVPAEIDPDFAAAHRAGRLRYHSLSLYLPDSAANPKPGHLYPRHLGFLGATPPAIKGLRRANFAAADPDTLTLTFTESPGAPMPDPKTPTPPAPTPDAGPDLTAQFAEREAHLSAREQELEARAAALAQAEAERARAAGASFAEALVAQGRLLPRDSAPVAALLASLAADATAQVDFAEPASADTPPQAQTAAAWLRAFLGRLPVQVDFGERSRPGPLPAAVNFSAPAGYTVDSANLAIHAKALAWLETHPDQSYQAAVTAVTGA